MKNNFVNGDFEGFTQVVPRDMKIEGDIIAQGAKFKTITSHKGLNVTDGNPGPFVEKRYGRGNDRYGLSQEHKGQVHLYAAERYGPAKIHIGYATNDGNNFKNTLSVDRNKVNVNSGKKLCIGNTCINEEALKSLHDISNNSQVHDWYDDFSNGSLNNWNVHTNKFKIMKHNGKYVAGIKNPENNAPKTFADVVPPGYRGGKKPSFFSYWWYEWGASIGGGIILKDQDGNLVVGFATDNPQWNLHDGDGHRQIYSNKYKKWTNVQFKFNWSDGKYDYKVEDEDGRKKTGTRNLASTKGIERIVISNYHGNKFRGNIKSVMLFDKIYIGSGKLCIGGTCIDKDSLKLIDGLSQNPKPKPKR